MTDDEIDERVADTQVILHQQHFVMLPNKCLHSHVHLLKTLHRISTQQTSPQPRSLAEDPTQNIAHNAQDNSRTKAVYCSSSTLWHFESNPLKVSRANDSQQRLQTEAVCTISHKAIICRVSAGSQTTTKLQKNIVLFT